MAIYHLSAKVISRAGGRSSVGAAAYRSGSTLRNERDGQVHDYSRKRFVEHAEILAPDNAPDWMRDRAQLWNAVEVAEKRKDAQLAREIEVALPRELEPHEQRELIRSFVRAEFVERGMIADIAIHNPRASDGQDQPHAHVMLTMRALTGEGFGAKNRDWNGKDQLGEWRSAWEDHANRALERHGHESRIDHRTLDAQREAARERGDEKQADALDREPQPKLGIAAAGMERRGVASERGEGWREAEARNEERRSIREQLREIGERIAELGGQIRDGVRSAARTLRDRLSRAAATVMERSRNPDAERDDRHEPGSAAERIAERLRAAEAEQNRGRGPGRDDCSSAANPADGRAREGPPERGQERQGGEPKSAEDRIAERLLQRFHNDQDKVRERERTREQELDRTRSKDRDYER